MITIEEFMTAQPCTLSETDTVADARQIMTSKHIRHIPITNANNHVLGLVTQRDVLAASGPELVSCDTGIDIPLTDVMIRNVSVIHKNDSLRQAAVYLQEHKYGCLPVVEDNQLVGIITDSDFIAIAINLLEQADLAEDGDEIEADDMIDDMDLSDLDDAL